MCWCPGMREPRRCAAGTSTLTPARAHAHAHTTTLSPARPRSHQHDHAHTSTPTLTPARASHQPAHAHTSRTPRSQQPNTTQADQRASLFLWRWLLHCTCHLALYRPPRPFSHRTVHLAPSSGDVRTAARLLRRRSHHLQDRLAAADRRCVASYIVHRTSYILHRTSYVMHIGHRTHRTS